MPHDAATSTREEELAIDGPLATRITARGPYTLIVLLVMAIGALLIWLGLYHHNEMKADNERLRQGEEEMVWALLQPDSRRQEMHIDMPPSLRGRVRFRHEEER